ncbi:uncharacterized protein LOC111313478 isoform X2 [Durio zibethinus]|uniref:Uncharacterized protein LOC111313478 isoform X2 n=1 Tax=Durio zibethinus TaxID=66656 RepID=A0A6P6AYN3_DURZI|nr:uncharacterized protein LOC111313478 isoform X2 [Durio zibethinus]
MDSFPDLYPLTSLQIGNIQSYLSRAFLFFAPISKKFLILVDNQSWRMNNHYSRSAHIKELMSTTYRISPFKNSRTLPRSPSLRSRSPSSEKSSNKWLPTVTMATWRENSPFSALNLYKTLHGFIVFDVAWEDVRGINYTNLLQKDASLALEVKSMRKWEFNGIAQALSSISSWFSATPSETLTLQRNLIVLQEKVHSRTTQGITISSRELLFDDTSKAELFSEDAFFDVRQCFLDTDDKFIMNQEVESLRGTSDKPTEYQHTFLLFSFNDRNLPPKLRQIITSDLKLLAFLEAGLPSWVIFLQSYPLFCKVYRHWMPPLLSTIFIFVSLITIIIGFYDLYKNVPLLKSTASHLCGPLFKWIEAWDMISRIRYLGTFLFLQNLVKAVKWFLMMARAMKLPVLLLTRPLMQPLEEIMTLVIPAWTIFAGTVEQFYITAWILVEPFCSLVSDFVEILLSPLGLLYKYVWSAVQLICACFECVWELLLTSTKGGLMLANYVASTFHGIYAMLEKVPLTSSINQITYVSQVKSASSGVSYWHSLQNDLYKEVFQSLRNIIRGLVAFLTSCNQHRLSIYNHLITIFRHSPHLDPKTCSSHQASIHVDSNHKVLMKKCDCCHHRKSI